MMTRPSGLAAAERYALQSRIISDRHLSALFLAVCKNERQRDPIDETTLAIFEAGGLVRSGKYGVVLSPEGRAFARDLGLVPPPSSVETNFERSMTPSGPISEHLVEVWGEFKRTGDESLRNRLMEHYLPLAKYNAERIHKKLPDEVDVEDLMSAGIFGLMDAIDAFDPQSEIKFEAYCAPRIRGYILDELRSMDWVPRLDRSRSSEVDQVRRELEMQIGRKPTDEELAEEFAKIGKDTGAVGVARKWFETDPNNDVREIDVLEEGRQANRFKDVEKGDLKHLITKGLTRAERLIVILYYYEEMTMKDIANNLNMSESRVLQMHSSILSRLKAQLAHRAKSKRPPSGGP